MKQLSNTSVRLTVLLFQHNVPRSRRLFQLENGFISSICLTVKASQLPPMRHTAREMLVPHRRTFAVTWCLSGYLSMHRRHCINRGVGGLSKLTSCHARDAWRRPRPPECIGLRRLVASIKRQVCKQYRVTVTSHATQSCTLQIEAVRTSPDSPCPSKLWKRT